MTFDQYFDDCRREEMQLLRLEAHYRKEAVCEPGCSHSPTEPLCSRHSSPQRRLTTGSDEGEGT